mmetsp:Transcript_13588/g.23896  ORF Transcript_13588/g.23896 Transcript_13588/m.23896 type:complete len:97 (-) Transcript_13588:1374-1664(-)
MHMQKDGIVQDLALRLHYVQPFVRLMGEPFERLLVGRFMLPFTLTRGTGANEGKNTARMPSAQMMGRMMRAAQTSNSTLIHRPRSVGRGSNRRPIP